MFATTVYVVTEEVFRLLRLEDDPQSKMSNAEIVTFAILTAKFFSGNYKLARYFCKKLGVLFWLIALRFYVKFRSARTFRSTASAALHPLTRAGPCLRYVLQHLLYF